MNKENKLIPGLPSGFEDRWDKKLSLKKKLIRTIENNFVKYGFDPLETPSFEISENIGSFLADDDSNPMSDVFSFKDGDKKITLRYDLSSPLARFVAKTINSFHQFTSVTRFKMSFEMKKLEMLVIENLPKLIVIL